MFHKNESHNIQSLFSPEQMLPEKLQKRLKNHWSAIFYKEIFVHINEDDFSELYCEDNGRPNVPVNILVGFEILKELFKHTDEVTYERFLFDTTFQKALGVEDIEKCYFSIRSLYNFPKKISDLIKEDEDSISYRLPSDEVGMTTGLFLNETNAWPVVRKIALFLYEMLHQNNLEEKLCQSDAYQKAKRLLKEQCNISNVNRNVELELKEPKDISSSSLQNPVDGDATYRKKRDKKYRGYSAHATETCDPSNSIQVITQVDLVANNKDDAKVLNENIEELKQETDLETMIADGGYHSPEISETTEQLEIEIITTAIRGKKTKKKDILDTESFEFEKNGLIAKCPNGHRPISQKLNKDKRLTASFDRRKCDICPLKNRCIAHLSEKQSRLEVNSNRRWLDKRRSELFNEDYITLCRLRPAVEGLMDKIKPKYLHGRTLFRTLPRVKNRIIFTAISQNFSRLVRHTKDSLNYLTNSFEKLMKLNLLLKIQQNYEL